jgi:hypothetical protein
VTKAGEARRYFDEVVLPYHGDECLIWPFARTHSYATIKIDGRQMIVSRLLCEANYGDPPGPDHEAAHSCGRGMMGCVAQSHITWKTPKENAADKEAHGTRLLGERSPNARLTDDQVRLIRDLGQRMGPREIAGVVGIGRSAVAHVLHRRTWAHVQ